MRRIGSLILGAALGAALAAAVALLLAPGSGDETRGRINTYFNQLAGEVRNARLQKRIELEHQLAELRQPTPEI